MPSFIPTPTSTPVFCFESLIILLSSYLFASVAVFCCGILALLLPLSVLSPPLPLESSPLRTFKQSLSDESRPRRSTNSAKLFCLFLAFGAYNPDDNNKSYNPTDNNKRKRGFDSVFINSCPLASNHN